MTPEEISSLVIETIHQVIADSGRKVDQVSPDDPLREKLGLDSLDLAVVVVRMQQETGLDPFRRQRQSIHNVENLVRAYQEELTTV